MSPLLPTGTKKAGDFKSKIVSLMLQNYELPFIECFDNCCNLKKKRFLVVANQPTVQSVELAGIGSLAVVIREATRKEKQLNF